MKSDPLSDQRFGNLARPLGGKKKPLGNLPNRHAVGMFTQERYDEIFFAAAIFRRCDGTPQRPCVGAVEADAAQ
jgi:hypothetical protein